MNNSRLFLNIIVPILIAAYEVYSMECKESSVVEEFRTSKKCIDNVSREWL